MTAKRAEKIAGPRELLAPVPLVRILRVDDIEDGEERLIETTESERSAVASLLALEGLERLTFAARLYRRGEGRIDLRGTLAAAVRQMCVVTLEPIEAELEVPVEVEFWPVSLIEKLADSSGDAFGHAATDWPEPIIDGKIDLGRVIYDLLAVSLDPYPKREGTNFEWEQDEQSAPAETGAGGPFAALRQLKQR